MAEVSALLSERRRQHKGSGSGPFEAAAALFEAVDMFQIESSRCLNLPPCSGKFPPWFQGGGLESEGEEGAGLGVGALGTFSAGGALGEPALLRAIADRLILEEGSASHLLQLQFGQGLFVEGQLLRGLLRLFQEVLLFV